MNNIFSSPIFVIFFAIFPAVSLLANNVREIEWQFILRPAGLSLLIGLLGFVGLQIHLRDVRKSGLITVIFIAFFFTYGHLGNFLISSSAIEISGKPNRYLLILYGLFLLVSIWWVLKKYNGNSDIIQGLNFVSVGLIIFAGYQIISYEIFAQQVNDIENSLPINHDEELRDVYYIILDGYGRSDLLAEQGVDNSSFIDELENREFYVADCSRSNYAFTLNSISTVLNLDYVFNVVPNYGFTDTDTMPIIQSIRTNRVRTELKSLGYTDVAFNMGYRWAGWWDADLYLPKFNRFAAYVFSNTITPFELLFMETTFLNLFIQRGYLDWAFTNTITNEVEGNQASVYSNHFKRVHQILDSFPEIIGMDGPKLVYLHMMVPHSPFIFNPDGSFNPDRNYYDHKFAGEQWDHYKYLGYRNNVDFINNEMLSLVDTILAQTNPKPIIIIQGDHGYLLRDERRLNILNAYYLPEGGTVELYPEITPVNSFRIVFNRYFGGDFPLLADNSIKTDIGRPYSERLSAVTACP